MIVKLFSKGGALLFSHETKGVSSLEVGVELAEKPFFSKHIDEWGCNMIVSPRQEHRYNIVMKTSTYKAIAYEHSNGSKGYHMGTGVAFSNSIKKAIKAAKHRAYGSLSDEEAKANDCGVSILATVEVFRGLEKVYFESY